MKPFDLKGFREDFSLSQTDLAKMLGVKQAFVSQVERGLDPMPDKWIDKIKEIYKSVDLSKYFDNPNIINVSEGVNSGVNNTLNQCELISGFLSEITAQRKMTEALQGKLFELIDKLTGKL
ncbi:MAG: helix-turn-helix transcriptional regulator [Bacteroidales bacterium]|nr:helix-turn-helix transcriptional regulator [Bacteroidales bacterium]